MTFRAVDPKEAQQADFVACIRAADLPPISAYIPELQQLARENRAASTRQPCEGCGETILVSPGAPPGVPRICLTCHQDVADIAKRAAGKAS